MLSQRPIRPPSEERPNMDSAMAFLKKVKEAMPVQYDELLDLLTKFKAKRMEADVMVTRMLEMLDGREYLLEGFSRFLPLSCRQSLMDRYTSSHKRPPVDPCGTPDSKRWKTAETLVAADQEDKIAATKLKPAKRLLKNFDRESLIGTLPIVESKRKREYIGARELRPNASFRDPVGIWRQPCQTHVWQAKMKDELWPQDVEKSWARLKARVDATVDEILKDPQGWIPSIDFQDIAEGRVSQAIIDKIRKTGVLRIRRVIPKEQATDLNHRIMEDFKAHFNVDPECPETYTNRIYSEKQPKAFTFGGVQELYYTKAQFEARQHKNMHTVKVWLNKMWKYVDEQTKDYLFVPEAEMTYVDRWRHRLPGYEKQTGMKEHLDNGAMCRWADPAWRKVYENIMNGSFEQYDPWVVSERTKTAGSFFRSFQGWLALTPQGSEDGTLEVVPMLADAMAYLLLRPFISDVPMHQFCGVSETGGSDTLEITSRWHAALLRGKIPVGHVDEGDTVWWHPDIIHGVEAEHKGTTPSNVLYIAAAPMCPQNVRYVAKQREAYLKGEAPPDFPQMGFERGSPRVAGVHELSPLGRKQMGFEPWAEEILEDEKDEVAFSKKLAVMCECNQILFPDGKAHVVDSEGRRN